MDPHVFYDAKGGYNIRVVRSKTPDGPYLDAKGQDMINCVGSPYKLFDDPVYSPFGTKLMGNYRFTGTGEYHSVRTHQFFFNDAGWPVVAPYRYAGETIRAYEPEKLAGPYRLIAHGTTISAAIKESVDLTLENGGKVSGALQGSWSVANGNNLDIVLDGLEYTGKFLCQWQTEDRREGTVFTALSKEGLAIWGSGSQ